MLVLDKLVGMFKLLESLADEGDVFHESLGNSARLESANTQVVHHCHIVSCLSMSTVRSCLKVIISLSKGESLKIILVQVDHSQVEARRDAASFNCILEESNCFLLVSAYTLEANKLSWILLEDVWSTVVDDCSRVNASSLLWSFLKVV
jgi:hypothetical protein